MSNNKSMPKLCIISRYHVYLISMILFLFPFASAISNEKPAKPLNFKVSILDEDDDIIALKFSWDKNTQGTVPSNYLVYYVNKNSDNSSDFSILYDLKNFNNDKNSFITQIKKGEYSFYVVAAITNNNQRIESEPSDIIHLNLNFENEPYIKIVSTIPDSGKTVTNKLWSYQIKVSTNTQSEVTYFLEGHYPNGMYIDNKSGLVTWTPTEIGIYQFAVKVILKDNPNLYAFQSIKLYVDCSGVSGDKVCAALKGKAVDENGSVVTEGVVTAWMIEAGSYEFKKFSTLINDEGEYLLPVTEGDLVLEINGARFFRQWYSGAAHLFNAKIIHTKCSDTVDCNFTVKFFDPEKFYKVRGRVYSDKDSFGLPAKVIFNVDNYCYNFNFGKKAFQTYTDAQGFYEIELSDKYGYIAHTEAMSSTMMYYDLYYKNSLNPLEACRIYLKSDLNNVDFALKSKDIAKYGNVSGMVISENADPIISKVLAFRKKDFSIQTDNNITTETDSSGRFNFNQLEYGEYYFLVIPFERKYVPGYYYSHDLAKRRWNDASTVCVYSQDIKSIEIKLKENETEKGIAEIEGVISSESNTFFVQDKILKVPGALIYIVDDNNTIIDFTTSDENGIFKLNQITEGINVIEIDKVNFEPINMIVQTNYTDKSFISLEILMKSLTKTSIEETDINDCDLEVVTDAKSYITIKPSDVLPNSRLMLCNTLGNIVINRQLEPNTETIIDCSNFSSGLYYLTLINKEIVKSKKLLITK